MKKSNDQHSSEWLVILNWNYCPFETGMGGKEGVDFAFWWISYLLIR